MLKNTVCVRIKCGRFLFPRKDDWHGQFYSEQWQPFKIQHARDSQALSPPLNFTFFILTSIQKKKKKTERKKKKENEGSKNILGNKKKPRFSWPLKKKIYEDHFEPTFEISRILSYTHKNFTIGDIISLPHLYVCPFSSPKSSNCWSQI